MTHSPLPSSAVTDEVEQLSTTLPEGGDAMRIKDLLQKELENDLDVFPNLVHKLTGIGDLVRESANRRVIIRNSRDLISTKEILAFTTELTRSARMSESFGDVVTVSSLYSVLSRSPKAIRKCFSASAVRELTSASKSGNCISCQLLGNFVRACCRRSQQQLLVRSCAKSIDFITSNEFVELVMSEISGKFAWKDSMKDTPYYYAIFVERYVFLHLDPQRSGKVSIQDLMATRLLDDLFDVLYEQSQENTEQTWDISQLSWCSVNNFWRILEQFRHCDRDWSGMVSLEECRYLKDGAFTPLFLERVFATQMLYGDDPKAMEMDFRGFVELDAAVNTRKETAAIKWLFRVLDLKDDGFLDRDEIRMMTESMVTNLAKVEGWANFNPDDIVDEVIDMINPHNPNLITVDEVIASRMADTALGILIDYYAFLKYENREEESAS
ncbi:unnamed protein product [Cylicocyclus nassatus]|uniref:EF-hand domain-containing protein n=1 Tax=Cylicocyclus nassatus TaxID=53992 RepID=A0AA36LZ77_CYLNA|nr:unnamed protein product [Cylicocyclus nassatus]